MEKVAAATLLMVSMTTSAIFAPPTDLPTVKPPFTVIKHNTVTVSNPDDAALEMDANLLAAVARAEDPEAPTAVMWVVRNRSRWYRGDIWSAVMDGEAFGTRKVWVEGRAPEWRPINLSWHRNARMIQLEGIAYRVLLGRVKDPTGGATHFHRVGTWDPPWAPPMDQRRIFGSHYFYKAYKPEPPPVIIVVVAQGL